MSEANLTGDLCPLTSSFSLFPRFCLNPQTSNLTPPKAPSSNLQPIAAEGATLRPLVVPLPSSLIQAQRSSLVLRFFPRLLISVLCPPISGFSIVPHPSAAIVPRPSVFSPTSDFCSLPSDLWLFHRPSSERSDRPSSLVPALAEGPTSNLSPLKASLSLCSKRFNR